MDFFSAYDVDGDEAENGKWFDFPMGVQFKIRRANSKKAVQEATKVFQPYNNLKNIPEEVSTGLLAESLAKGVVVEWRGLQNNGKTVKCPEDSDKRVEMLLGWLKEFPELAVTIAGISGQMENFLKEQELEQEKN